MNSDTPEDKTIVQPGPSGDGSPAPTPASPPAPGRQDSGNALPLGTYLDEFELRSVAGEGGFSIVYRAWDHSLKRQVAVKEYFPSGMVGRSGGTQVVVRSERHADAFEAGLKSFVEEARLLAQFDHPALIKVYRFWKANGSAYMVMPFCEGITLREDWRSRADPPDEATLMSLLDPLTEALGVLHAERWYHRDIAPDNVMLLAGTRRPLLLDFGAARQVIGDMTHALTVILKPGYAPIEQWGEVPGMKQGPWTDVYALAAMIHFGITRQTPPPSVGRLVNDGYVPLAQAAAGRYSDRFLSAVDHALAVRPEHRTQSIEQFRDEIGLDEMLRERTMTWMPPGATTTLRAGPTVIGATAGLPPATSPPATSPLDAAPTITAAPEFTVRMEGADPVGAGPDPAPAPAPAPARSRSQPALLFGAAMIGTAVVGALGYAVFKPAPAPVAQVVPTPAPPPPADPPASVTAAAPEPAPAPAPAAAPAPARFDIAREFRRVVQSQSTGHQVEVTLVRTTVRSDKDDVAFTIRSSHEGLLYIYNRGSDGSLLQVYPNRKSGLVRIRKDVPLDMPRASDDVLRITGPSGTTDLLVMVSHLQRDHTGLPVRVESGYSFYPTGASAEALSAQHTGPLPWFVGKPKCPASGPCDDTYGAAVATLNIVQ